jgi:HEPN domain-containing protein
VHLSIEKLSKALWVKENQNNYPPRLHEVKYLLADTSFVPHPEQSLFIDNLQKYQIEGRYPDYRKLIYSYTTLHYTECKKITAMLTRRNIRKAIDDFL